jgi:hypothetical protein
MTPHSNYGVNVCFYDLRFTTAPIQSVICEQKMSYIGTFKKVNMLVCYSYFVKINVLPYIKNQATDSQKVVNRKLGRMTVFAIYDRFIKLTDCPVHPWITTILFSRSFSRGHLFHISLFSMNITSMNSSTLS